MALFALGLVAMGCSKANPEPAPPSGQLSEGEHRYTARTGDGVDVLYFEEGNPCECMADFGTVIKNTIRTRFASELQEGSLRFFVVVSDDWENREVLESFDNPLYDLFIMEYKNGQGTAAPVREIWSMMGDDDALASYVDARISDALAGYGTS